MPVHRCGTWTCRGWGPSIGEAGRRWEAVRGQGRVGYAVVGPEMQGARVWDAWPRRVEGGSTGAAVGRTGRRRRHLEAAAGGEAGGAHRGGSGGGTRLGAVRVAWAGRDVRRGRDVRPHRGCGFAGNGPRYRCDACDATAHRVICTCFAIVFTRYKDYCASYNSHMLLGVQLI